MKDLRDEELGRTGTSLRWRQLEKKDKDRWIRSPDGYCTSSDEDEVSKWFAPREEPREEPHEEPVQPSLSSAFAASLSSSPEAAAEDNGIIEIEDD